MCTWGTLGPSPGVGREAVLTFVGWVQGVSTAWWSPIP